MTDPRYVDFGTNLVWPLPARLSGASLDSFLFCSPDLSKVQGLIDRVFSAPSGGAVAFDAMPFLGLTFSRYQGASSLAEGFSQRGSWPYNEVAITVYMKARKDAPAAGVKAGDTVMFLPYVWVDQIRALVGGRELYGMVKDLASFTIPAQPADPAAWSVTTMAIPKYGPSAAGAPFEVLRVVGGAHAAQAGALSPWEGAAETLLTLGGDTLKQVIDHGSLAGDVAALPAELRAVFDAAHDVTRSAESPANSIVCLRQLRAPGGDGVGASPQSVIVFRTTSTGMKLSLLGASFTVQAVPCDSEPVAAELGLTGPVSALGLHSECDLTLGAYVTLYP